MVGRLIIGDSNSKIILPDIVGVVLVWVRFLYLQYPIPYEIAILIMVVSHDG